MKTLKQRKKVVVPYNGYIHILGIGGPIEIPTEMELRRISDLLLGRYPVYEVLNDGRRVKLDLTNFNKDLGGSSSSKKSTYESVNRQKKTSVIKISDTDVDNASMTTILKRSTQPVEGAKTTPSEGVIAVTDNSVKQKNSKGEKPHKNFLDEKKEVEEEDFEMK